MIQKIDKFNALSPDAYSLANLTVPEIFQGLSSINKDAKVIWNELHQAYGKDFFLRIIEEEYGPRLRQDHEKVSKELDAIQEDAEF